MTSRNFATITSCQRCGTCCVNGGPALHESDLHLIHDHRFAIGDLFTIRQGEPVFSPLANGVEPARTELIKLTGQNDSWACHYFDQTKNACGIYAHRPLECRLLKCWEPSALTDVIYRHCLCRQDVLPDDEEIWDLIKVQEEHCGFAKIALLSTEFAEANDTTILAAITRIVTLDLKIRHRASQVRKLGLAEELLFFGRPLFKSLAYYQLTCQEGSQGLTVQPAKIT